MKNIFGILFLLLIVACHSNKSEQKTIVTNIKTDTSGNFGNRLSIVGDFDGDGKIDTLKESFISSVDGKETNKYCDTDYDSMVTLTIAKKPICKLLSLNLQPLIINKDNWQVFGLSYLKNEGDLNADNTDEIGLIVDWADWSNVNYYQVYTYRKNNWQELLKFEIRDFDIADMKENKDSKGLLYKDSIGNLIAKTWEMGEQIETKIKIK